MLLRSIKIGVGVIAIAALAYVFYPGSSRIGWHTARSASHGIHGHHSKTVVATRKSSQSNRVTAADAFTHGGPPSKM